MENNLRIVHVMDDGTLRVHVPDPGSRRVTKVRLIRTDEVLTFADPVPLWQAVGVYEPGKCEAIEGETDAEHAARTGAKSAECIQREKEDRPADAGPRKRELSRHAVTAISLPVRTGKTLFREAWRFRNGKVEVDLPLARGVKLAQIRRARDAKLVESDGDKHRLDDIGTGPQKQALAAYRQALRDLPATLQLDGLTAEQLHDFEPAWPVKPGG